MHYEEIAVLAIEDDTGDRTLLGRYLEGMSSVKATLLEAASFEDALETLKAHDVDLLIIDYMLSDENGLDIYKKIRGMDYELPSIMMTGQGNELVAVEAIKSGIEDYLVKSMIGCENLERAIRNALEKFRLRKQVEMQQRMLQKLATTDELTGLYNRRSLLEKLTLEVQRSDRYHVPLSVLLLDLDFFKTVNDNYGHLMGDQVLSTTAKTLKSMLRSTDIAGRYGGEEFCVVLTNTNIRGAERIAERIRSAICKLAFKGPEKQPIQITCSIGVAEFQKGMHEPGSLLTQADQALYSAKTNGRNCVKYAQ